jgi:hypothetical protein
VTRGELWVLLEHVISHRYQRRHNVTTHSTYKLCRPFFYELLPSNFHLTSTSVKVSSEAVFRRVVAMENFRPSSNSIDLHASTAQMTAIRSSTNWSDEDRLQVTACTFTRQTHRGTCCFHFVFLALTESAMIIGLCRTE